ncbi:Sporulation stage V, protein G [Candidatus Omnitrophus magneticus]|uniref:Sporulation stage V, protein G n=1 Tax=Candidatus Omnitrophus magneticus TaxID=1609969 RepID=A0A0F0CP58_9BACT|nr:Sporulation stage V, protein G [Candidatus Omnitrophus magneticus]
MEKQKLIIKVDRMYLLNGEGATKAFCDIVIQDIFLVKGLRIVDGKEGIFVGMPRTQAKDGKWYDIFSVLEQENRKALQNIILNHYKNNAKEPVCNS